MAGGRRDGGVWRRRDGDITPYRNGTGPWDLATGPRNGARRREPGGPAAKWGAPTGDHRALAQRDRMVGGRRDGGAGAWERGDGGVQK